jgi:hypothetical protein
LLKSLLINILDYQLLDVLRFFAVLITTMEDGDLNNIPLMMKAGVAFSSSKSTYYAK